MCCIMRRGRTNSILSELRPVCKHGTSCYRRNPAHLREESHPADEDYLECCEKEGIAPEFVSVRRLFEHCDVAGTGKVSKDNLGKIWQVLQRLGTGIGSLEDAWEKLDDDGNGYINFSEFAEFTTMCGVPLPLGLDDLLKPSGSSSSEDVALRCGVVGCPCRCFVMRRPRCKYGESCYQSNPEHRKGFIHPGDEGWEASSSTTVKDKYMCQCGHKQKLHASRVAPMHLVSYPKHWTSEVTGDQEVNARVPARDEKYLQFFQMLMELTYSDVTTRDRVKSCGTWEVPRNFIVKSVVRNENTRLWRKYKMKKADLLRESSYIAEDATVQASLSTAAAQPEFGDYSAVKTTEAYTLLMQKAKADPELGLTAEDELEPKINEWVLLHGTSASAAENICGHDFTMRLAGSSTGTLYGRGTYLAESCTKADEYAREEDGVFTMLCCRVLGGRVRYCDERTPDAEALMADCTEGMYDCILGDRIKTSGTYREFVVFDTENVYPEYIITYTRGEFFKSPSHP